MHRRPPATATATATAATLHDLLRGSSPSGQSSGLVDWDAVLRRSISHPEEAAEHRNYGLRGTGRPRCPLQLALTARGGGDGGGGASGGGERAGGQGGGGGGGGPCPPSVVRALIAAHPSAASSEDELGLTPLFYAAVHGSSSSVVRALLDAHSEAASRSERYYGKIPLHVATDAEVARELLDAYPRGVGRRNVLGHVPLHKAAASAEAGPELVRLLVRRGKEAEEKRRRKGRDAAASEVGGVAGEDDDDDECGDVGPLPGGGALAGDVNGKTPLDYLCEKIVQRTGSTANGPGGEEAATTTMEPLTGSGLRYWEKLVAIAEEVVPAPPSPSPSPKRGKPPLVHALIELSCPSEVILRAIRMHPEQLIQRDHGGRTPLALAASNPRTLPDVIARLLHPSFGRPETASVPDHEGRLPLHHMAASGRGFGDLAEGVLRAHPEALNRRERVHGFCPLMLAAVEGRSSLDAVYGLLRECPASVVAT